MTRPKKTTLDSTQSDNQPSPPGVEIPDDINGDDVGNFAKYGASQDFDELAPTKVLFTHIPTKRPPKTAYIRAHPKRQVILPLFTFGRESDKELFLIEPDVLGAVLEQEEDAVKRYRLVQAVTKQNTLYLWPIAVPDELRPNMWHVTANALADKAIHQWIRIQTSPELGYWGREPRADLPDPKWPDVSFEHLSCLLLRTFLKRQSLSGENAQVWNVHKRRQDKCLAT